MIKDQGFNILLPLTAHHHHVGGGLLGGLRLGVPSGRGGISVVKLILGQCQGLLGLQDF